VSHEFPHHREAGGLDVLLHRGADVRYARSRAHRVDAAEQRLFGHPQEFFRLRRDLAHRHRHRAVPVVAVEHRAHVERHDVAGGHGRRDGMPCTTCSFTDAHTVAGYP
jgi:hypothetical protein